MPEASPSPNPAAVIDELQWRGLIHQCTDATEGLVEARKHLATPRRVYCGFDPTADSLTIGNLVPIMLLRHFQRFGHTPVVVMGGGTGLIGDPSGKSAERELMTPARVAANVESQKRIFGRILDFKSQTSDPRSAVSDRKPQTPNPALLVNNLDWLGEARLLDVLRDVGKFFSVNAMMQKDSVRERLQNRDQGISFTEFSYQILQAMDFTHLYEAYGVTMQVGGSDQWGNIVAGSDLIQRHLYVELGNRSVQRVCVRMRRPADWARYEADLNAYIQRKPQMAQWIEQVATMVIDHFARSGTTFDDPREVIGVVKAALLHLGYVPFGLTAPLVTKADGGKFGKTETGAVWLTAERTSPYAYYQFWLNADDRDVERFLKIFTLLTREEIESLIAQHAADPGARHAHRALARAATALLHGEAEMQKAEAAARALFSGEVATLDEATLREAFASAPTTTHKKSELSAAAPAPVAAAPGSDEQRASAPGKSLVDLLVETGLAKSKREAREFLQNGSIALNGAKVGPDDRLTEDRLLHRSVALLRRGKKQWHVTRWE